MTATPPNSAWNAQSEHGPAGIYRQEAVRLRQLANTNSYSYVRNNMLDIARQYDLLAEQAEHLRQHGFGRPFRRRPEDRSR
jgi:hypothetical protein